MIMWPVVEYGRAGANGELRQTQFWTPIGVRPYGRAGSGFDFDPLPGVVILKLLGAQISECRM
jgi:hypothetical protein